MPLNGLNTGIDCTITFTDVDGVENFTILESFTSSENANVPEHVAMDGITRFPKFHLGWKGTVVFQRNSDFLDNYIAAQEANYYLGGDQLPLTVTQTVKAEDGSISQWQYTNGVLNLTDAGMYSGTDIVKQTGEMSFSRKQKLL